MPLERKIADELDLLGARDLRVAPAVVSGAAVARERPPAVIEVALPNNVGIVRCESRFDCGPCEEHDCAGGKLRKPHRCVSLVGCFSEGRVLCLPGG